METTKVNQHLVGMSYDNIIPKLDFIEDDGGCCGFATYSVTNELPESISTKDLVLKDCVQIQYDNEYKDRTVLNFVFSAPEGELILGYELCAGSGSGWSYGAFVRMKLGKDVLAEASW